MLYLYIRNIEYIYEFYMWMKQTKDSGESLVNTRYVAAPPCNLSAVTGFYRSDIRWMKEKISCGV